MPELPPSTAKSEKNIEIIAIQGQNQRQTYRIRTSLRFERFFEVYLQRHPELPKGEVRFFFNQTALQKSDTPESLGLYDKAVIEVIIPGESA